MLDFEVKTDLHPFCSVLFLSFFYVRVVIDNEACKNATVIRVRVLVFFFGGCVLFSLDHHSYCFLDTKYFIVLQVHSANKHGTLLCGILIHVQIHVQILIHIKSQCCCRKTTQDVNLILKAEH
jgi:hypothetical protein